MKQIFKYILQPAVNTPQVFMLQLADNNSILSVQKQLDTVCIWALIDASKPEQKRVITVHTTGAEVPDNAKFLATVQFNNGEFVFHVFDETEV